MLRIRPWMPILFSIFCMEIVSTISFCFIKDGPSNRPKAPIINKLENTIEMPSVEPTFSNSSLLRSYHPHYIVSLSYPHPISPHIYFGEVIGDRPLFLYRDLQKWHPNSLQKLTINGIQFTDASAKYFLLRREEVFRYMLVIQMENSYEREIPFSMDVYERIDHYLIVCKYQSITNAFFIYLTDNGKLIELGDIFHPGVRVNVRNQSSHAGQNNWRFSRFVRWAGSDRFYDQSHTNFHGFIMELEYTDHTLMKSVKLNFKQVKFDLSIPVEDFLLDEADVFQSMGPQNITKVEKFQTCSQTAFQRLLDGLSYEFGRLVIRDGGRFVENTPKELLSFSPSVQKFPWGFLWDDGFHCEVAVRKDYKLTLKVIKSWLDTMLESGWIPREQNRGKQRQELCSCPRFMQKNVKDGNPPTLILALDYLNKHKMLTTQQLSVHYWQKIKQWYEWFMRTQKDNDIMLFKWHDSIHQQGASFTSGLDDFPRPNVAKGHIDLQTWMYFFTRFMAQVSHIYGQDGSKYIANLELIKNNFNFFKDPKDHTFRDINMDNTFSNHFGYPNILPIAFGIPPYGSPQYTATIQKIKEQLDLGFGLASLSKKNPLFMSNRDAYWRGPVWININYLFLRGLKLYYPKEELLYNKIREDVLRVVCGNWQKSGYFYENYIQNQGSFGFPFNGWTSLVGIIYEQTY